MLCLPRLHPRPKRRGFTRKSDKNSGNLIDESTTRLRAWIPRFAPDVDVALMNQWTELFYSKQMMYFYNKRAALCMNGRNDCSNIRGKNVFNAGLATQ
jgi:hypothetical protein